MRSRATGRIALVAISPVLFLALVEVALAVAGVAPPPRYPPNGTRAGLFDEIRFWVPVAPAGAAPGFARAFPALALEPDPNPRPAFVRDKPPNGFRTFVLGESTVAGYPLGKSFVDWVDVRLRAMLPDRSVEVVNAGNGGWYSAEVAALLHESLDHRPDLLVWAVGHNEVHPANLKNLREERDSSFAAIVKRIAWRLRTTRALARLIPRDARPAAADAADRSIGERPCYGDDLPALQARFRATVEDVVAAARARGVPIVLCTMPRNVRTYAPAASVFSPAVRDDGALRAQWEAAYSDGWAHLQGEASAAGARIALEELRRAAQIDNTPARLHFALGRAHELVGEMADARREFVAALDRDACPNRAQSWTEQATRDVARERNVPLLDIRALFDAAGAHGLTGAELLVDNVHPTFEGHERIADELIGLLERERIVTLRRDRDVPAASIRSQLGIDDDAANRMASRNASLANFKLALQAGVENDLCRRTREALAELVRENARDYEALSALGLLEAIAGDREAAATHIRRSIDESRGCRLWLLVAHRIEPPYQRAIDASGLDVAEIERNLPEADRRAIAARYDAAMRR